MKKLILLFGTLLIITASCKKDELVKPSEEPVTMENIQVPAGFEWRTTADYMINLSGPVNSLVELVSDQGVVFQRAYILKDQTLKMKLTVPSYEKVVYLQYLGQKVEMKLTSSTLNYQFK